MEHWEFLLQKEGDRSWLPLESPNVEILEGQYQVLARSNLIDTKIDVQVSHFFNRNGVPEQELQSGSRKTNSQGVVVVVPSTYLRPGLWQLVCTFSEMNDQQNAWCQSIQLQVLHQESDVPEDWESLNWQEQSLRESTNQSEFVTKEVQGPELASIRADLSQAQTSQAASVNSPHTAQSASSSTPRQRVKASSLHLPSFTNQAQLLRSRVSEGQVFPPQLAQSHTSEVVRKSPELPVVPRPKVSSVEIEMVRSYLEQADLHKPALAHQPLLVETAFEALRLKERFRSRLNTFAKNAETRASLEPNVTPQDSVSSNQENLGTQQTHLLVNPDQPQDEGSQIDATTTEIINPLEPLQEGEASLVSIPEPLSTDSQPSTFVDPVKSTGETVPVPNLVLPDEELVMGQLITIRVTLPDPSTPLYVKLWIKDRQTRSLLDGPRWLVEFALNDLGVLEASTQLVVPLGSLEVSFEAIAINMQTKSESYKATVDRLVMPLGLFLVEDSNSSFQS
jgi:hypothetical protein